jgi:hypothetical protein
MASLSLSAKQFITEAEATGLDYLDVWANAIMQDAACQRIGELAKELRRRPETHPAFIHHYEQQFLAEPSDDEDVVDDCRAWRELKISIAQPVGKDASLDHFL